MARDTAGTMLQSFEAIKEAVGLDIPKMLKDVSTGGLVGKCQSPIPADSKGTTDQDADAAADNIANHAPKAAAARTFSLTITEK